MVLIGAGEITNGPKQQWLRSFGYQHTWVQQDGGQLTFQNEAEILKFAQLANVVGKVKSTENLTAQSTQQQKNQRNNSNSPLPSRLTVKQLSSLYALYRMASICQQAGNEFNKANIADYEKVLKRAEKESLLNPGDIKLAWNDSAKSVELMRLLDGSGLRRYCREEVSSIKLFMLPFTDKIPDDKPF